MLSRPLSYIMFRITVYHINCFQYQSKRLAGKNVSEMTLFCVEWDKILTCCLSYKLMLYSNLCISEEFINVNIAALAVG